MQKTNSLRRSLKEDDVIDRGVFSAVLLAMIAVSSPVTKAAIGNDVLHGVHVPNCVCKRCCDDYCAKPLPSVCGARGCYCDDYCAKPRPCAVNVKQFCCDNYCPKCPPRIICPPQSGLKCPPKLPHCSQGNCPAPASVVPLAD